MLFKLTVAAMLCCAGSAGVSAASKTAVSNRDQQQAACYDDAQKLCADALPDVDKTIECMKPKKALVSAKCAAFYDK